LLSLAPDEHQQPHSLASASGPALASASCRPKPIDPAKLDACHASFGVWFQLAAPYDLTLRQHQLLRLEVPGYAATLERAVGLDWGPDDAFDALFKVRQSASRLDGWVPFILHLSLFLLL
jgi:hypothetical protein